MRLLRGIAAGSLILGGMIAGNEPAERPDTRPTEVRVSTIKTVAYFDEYGNMHEYDIPEMWLVGYTTNPGRERRTYHDAVRYWHEQALLADQWEREVKP